MTWIFLLCWFQTDQERIDIVRQGFLTYAPNAEISLVFENYRYFESTDWQLVANESVDQVVFTGAIDDAKAVKAFEDNNQYKLRFSFKAMQLQPTYGLTKDKKKLAFVIRFKLNQNKGFDIHSGQLGIFTEAGGWRYQDFTDKALAACIEGIYRNRDPYATLVKGLPYK